MLFFSIGNSKSKTCISVVFHIIYYVFTITFFIQYFLCNYSKLFFSVEIHYFYIENMVENIDGFILKNKNVDFGKNEVILFSLHPAEYSNQQLLFHYFGKSRQITIVTVLKCYCF